MNKKFSVTRILLLLQRYFLENLSREILFWCALILVFTVLDQRDFVRWVMYITGFAFSIRMYKELYSKTVGMHYLLIPATHAEKLTANIFLTTFYYFGMTLLSYCIGNLLVTLVYHQILNINVPVNWDFFIVTKTFFETGFVEIIEKNVFFEIFGTFAAIQAVGMLGSLYFNKNAALKTIFTIIIIGCVFVAVQLILFKTFWGVKNLENAILSVVIMWDESSLPPVFQSAITVGSYILIPFLWLVSYFRLSEKQI